MRFVDKVINAMTRILRTRFGIFIEENDLKFTIDSSCLTLTLLSGEHLCRCLKGLIIT